MLIDTMKETCALLDRSTSTNEIGDIVYTWVEGARFQAAIVKDNTMQARIAEKQGVTEIYTVTVDKGLKLRYYDVFKRLSDGAVFRVTSNITDSETPRVATFAFGQVTAERWDLP